MPVDEVQRALIRYTDNEVLEPEDVFGGPTGAIAHLQRLEKWFQVKYSVCIASQCNTSL